MELETRDDELEQDSFRAIGADLGTARREAGMQIQELVQLVRISRHHLTNLEAGDFDLLPGSTYVSGYIRTYSRVVGLDPKMMTQRYRALLTDCEAKQSYSFPVDSQQPQRSGAMMASIMVIFAGLGYGGWYAAGKPDLVVALVGEAPQGTVAAPQVETTVTEPDNLIIQETKRELVDGASTETSPLKETDEMAIQTSVDAATLTEQEDSDAAMIAAAPQTVAPDPAMPVTELGAETEQLATAASGTQSATGLRAKIEEAESPGESTLAEVTAPSAGDVDTQIQDVAVTAPNTNESAATATAGDAASSESLVLPSAGGDRLPSTGVAYARQRVPELEITVRATSISWVEIIRNDGEEVMAKLMREGEIYVVDSRDRLYLSTGNAGGVELVFQDGAVQSVGESGEILRDLPLDADKLRNQL